MKTHAELRRAQLEERIATVGLWNQDYQVQQVSGTLGDGDARYWVAGPQQRSDVMSLDELVDLVCRLAAADIAGNPR